MREEKTYEREEKNNHSIFYKNKTTSDRMTML